MKRVIFCNTGWMNFYSGLNNDKIVGGGKYVLQNQTGGEIYNFKSIRGRNYGYVRSNYRIDLSNFDLAKGTTEADEVLVIWTATKPGGGTYIVGWYRNAKAYEQMVESKDKAYHFVADTSNCRCLKLDERIVKLPRGVKGGFGQSNVWFATKRPDLINDVWNYAVNGIIPPFSTSRKNKGRSFQPDTDKKIATERAAVKAITKLYEARGFEIESREKDNVGWDLTATNATEILYLEVKGLSGSSVTAQLTPNEYACMNSKKLKNFYRICIVNDALKIPITRIFSYYLGIDKWTSETGEILEVEPIMAARVSLF